MEAKTKLFIVPTPIGNLKDITFRAIEVLKEVELILAEDTRKTGILLKHYDIQNQLQSFHSFNEHKKIHELTDKLDLGMSMALVSDAGTPGISDPAFLLVRACSERNIKVECLPGATAFVPALVKSGLPIDKFVFEGFLPHKKGRATRLREIASETRTVAIYESPYRLLKTLEQLQELIDSTRVVSVSRELTKIYEETVTGTIEEVYNHYKDSKIKGEIVVIVEGKKE